MHLITDNIGRRSGLLAQLPARTWTMALLYITSAAGMGGMAVAPLSAGAPVRFDGVCAFFLMLSAAALLVSGSRISDRGLLSLAAARIVIALGAAATATSAGGTFFACGGFVWVAIWVTVFFSRRVRILTLAAELLSVLVAAAINQHHLRTGVDAAALLFGSVVISTLLSQAMGDLRRDAHHDHLTGLLNRYGLDQALGHLGSVGRAGHRAVGPTSLVAFDLDGLKEVNDRGGHLAGDRMLVTFATELTSAAGSTGLPARIGGDEFIVILPGMSVGEATRWVGDLQIRSCVPWSFGVAERESDEGLECWLARADQRMYGAKLAGRRQLLPVAASI